MTVMLFQLEGSDETLQEGFRTINNAIDKLANPVVRVLPPSAAKALTSARNGDESEQTIVNAEYVEGTDEDEAPNTAPDKPKERSGSSWTPPQPKILDLDLKAGTVSLRDFMELKKPTTDNRKYLLIAAWMKTHLGIDEIGIHHIYTAYRHMGWTSQKDVGSPLRSMKSQNGWFNKGKEKGTYSINHIGLDQADRTNGD